MSALSAQGDPASDDVAAPDKLAEIHVKGDIQRPASQKQVLSPITFSADAWAAFTRQLR